MVPVENTTEGVVTQTLDTLRRAPSSRSAARSCCRSPSACSPGAGGSRTCGAWPRTRSRWPSAGAGSTATCPAPSASRWRAPSAAGRSPRAEADVAAVGSRLAAELLGLVRRRRERPGSARQLDALPRDRRRAAGAERPRPDLRGLHRAQGRGGRAPPPARALRRARRQPDQHPVPAAARARPGSTCSSSTSRATAASPRVAAALAEASQVAHSTRVLGSFPRRSGRGARAGRRSMSLADRVKRHVAELKPYEPGKPIEALERELGIRDSIKLASNENPLGPSPRAVEALRRAAGGVHRYPDGGEPSACGTQLAGRLGVAPGAAGVRLRLPTSCSSWWRRRSSARATRRSSPGRRSRCTRSSRRAWARRAVRVPLDADLVHDLPALARAVTPAHAGRLRLQPEQPDRDERRRRRVRRVRRRAPAGRGAGGRRGLCASSRSRPDFPDALAWVARRPGTAVLRTLLEALRPGRHCASATA